MCDDRVGSRRCATIEWGAADVRRSSGEPLRVRRRRSEDEPRRVRRGRGGSEAPIKRAYTVGA
eukprot:4137422-Pleurochrysis_carterae.AAC.1